MAHMPYLQLYFADWRNNAKLKRCSHELRGIWLEVMGLMHDSEEYGVLRWPLKDIAHAVGTAVAKLEQLRSYDILKGAHVGEQCAPLIYRPRLSGRKLGPETCILAAQGGEIWYCSRMVRDDHIRRTKVAKSAASGAAPMPPPDYAPKPPIGAELGAAPMPPPDYAPPSRAGTGIQNPESRIQGEEKEKARADSRSPPSPSSLTLLAAAGVSEAVAKDWLVVRKAKRAGAVTQTVMLALDRESRKAGISVADAVRICVEKGWQGFDAGWNWQSSAAAPKPAAIPKTSFAETDYTRGFRGEVLPQFAVGGGS